MSLKLFLTLFCGICWTITYVECIRIGFKYKIHTMPFLALVLNITWEAFNTYQGGLLAGWTHVSTVFDGAWLLLDCIILYIYLVYTKSESTSSFVFYGKVISLLVLGSVFQYIFAQQLGLIPGAVYSSSVMGLIMSSLFIKMYYDRGGAYGQSLSIAINKCLGTAAASLLVGLVGVNSLGGAHPMVLYVGIFIFFIDLYYIFLLCKKSSTIT
ncbi:transmembrane-type terpene cyclase [Aquimarina agarilytica]|uniref:transmembrane-type terpene cyclase n=1 Tax=Aquimarina agarilytica TaxID=1087449 RepID=UPI0004927506|nr:hypothetical protein [Aquimarina agarilytica]